MAITKDQFFDDDLMKQFPELAQSSQDMAEQLFPTAGLTPEEQTRLAALTNRAQRLSPIEAPQLQGSNRIQGNVFSIDDSPVYNAIQQGLVKVLNAKRQKRMLKPDEELTAKAQESKEAAAQITGEDEESNVLRKALLEEAEKFSQQAAAQSPSAQLTSLTEKEEEAAQNEQLQNELMMRLFPDLAGRAATARERLSTENVRHGNTLKEIEERGKQQIEAIRERAKLEAGGNTKSPEYAVGVITGFLGQTDPVSKSITNTISTLNEQRALVDDPSQIDKQIKGLEKKRAELQKWRSDAYKALSEGNLYDTDLIDRLDTIMGVEQQGNQGNQGAGQPGDFRFYENPGTGINLQGIFD